MSIKLIAHRGNMEGPTKWENHPDYLLRTLSQGFDCEVDVWLVDGKIFLGHDRPEHMVKKAFLEKTGFWLHAKNLEALNYLLTQGLICFWHENDAYTITSNGFIWANIGKPVNHNTILVSLSKDDFFESLSVNPYGICSDYVLDLRKSRPY